MKLTDFTSIFVTEDPSVVMTKPHTDEVKSPPAPAPRVAVVTTTPGTNITTPPVDGQRATTIIEALRAKLASAPTSATITQFQTIAESLSDAIPEEGARFRATLKTLSKTANVSQVQVTEAYAALLDVLEKDRAKFESIMTQQIEKEVTARETAIQNISNEIEQLSNQRAQLATDLVEARNIITGTQNSYETAAGVVTGEINDSLAKLKIYSGAVTAK